VQQILSYSSKRVCFIGHFKSTPLVNSHMFDYAMTNNLVTNLYVQTQQMTIDLYVASHFYRLCHACS
jgi:hypothetical protein